MSDENKTITQAQVPKMTPEQIKKLENDLKVAFKESRFLDVKKIGDQIKASDPENHLASRLLEKMEKAKAEQLIKTNAERVKSMESQMKDAFKNGQLMEIAKIAGEMKKIDPENKVLKKIELRIDKAKAVLDAQVKKEKIRGAEFAIKEMLKNEKWDDAVKKANELFKLDQSSGMAMKAFKTAAKAKKVDIKSLINITPVQATTASDKKPVSPVIPTEKKPGFFARLFSKKTEDASKNNAKPEAEKQKEGVKKISLAAVPAKVDTKPVSVIPATTSTEKKPLTDSHQGADNKAKEKLVGHEKKPGLFSGLFGKKTDTAVKTAETPKEIVKPVAQMPVKTDVKETPQPVAAKPIIQAIAPQPVVQKAETPKPAVVMPATELPKAVAPVAESPKAVTPFAFSAPAPSMIKPAVPVRPPVTAFKPVITQPSQPASPPIKPDESAQGKGNIFTNLFGKKAETDKPAGSIIETIVAQTAETKKLKREVVKTEGGTGEGFLRFSGMFLRFSIVFMVIGSGFFYIFNIDESNMVLSLAGKENNALQLKNAAIELEQKTEEKNKLEKEIDKYKKGYDNENKKIIDQIISNRMDWPKLIKDLNEVTESVYEKNALAQYVQYNNYSYNVGSGDLSVSATLSDPLGKNLTKLAEIEEAFMYYPKDKNDSNDQRKPYFYNMQGFSSYDKSFNKSTGRYTSNFTLSLSRKDKAN